MQKFEYAIFLTSVTIITRTSIRSDVICTFSVLITTVTVFSAFVNICACVTISWVHVNDKKKSFVHMRESHEFGKNMDNDVKLNLNDLQSYKLLK